jgi:serine/threonine protein kinase/formylglycine-generating enzyme required for sulfatase activity/dienelactone hydrolase
MAADQSRPSVDPTQAATVAARVETGLIGSHIGVYLIDSMLGAGAMGEVYRARDEKLRRDVALKILPTALTADSERLARFEHEARLLASLNHPNIATMYGLEDVPTESGRLIRVIVMELVEGETLAERVRRLRVPAHVGQADSEPRGLPLEDVLMIAHQIATAVAAAHRKGIIHRDLKPANIKITLDGTVKVLDFGLAKRTHIAESATATFADTQEGLLLGTLGYMSPEQTRGVSVDTRTDIWALGCVTYEMLTGRPAFARHTVADTLAAIVQQEPAWDRWPAQIPPGRRSLIQGIIGTCLKKDPGQRYQTMEDLAREFADASHAVAMPGRSLSTRAWMAAALTVLAVAGAMSAWTIYRASESRKVEQALAEATRLADADDYLAAFRRVDDVARFVPDDARVPRLLERVSIVGSIESVPPGADVYLKAYNDPSDGWISVGRTPIDQRRVPRGIFRWKVQQDGYQPLEYLSPNGGRGVAKQFVQLSPVDEAPPMVMVSASTLTLTQQLASFVSANVQLGAYRIGKYEVTNAEFKRFVDAGGYAKREYWTEEFVKAGTTVSWESAMAEFRDRTGRSGPSGWEVGQYPKGHDQDPVGGVSWYEAAAYANFARKALPTVYHWVRAAGVPLAAYIMPLSNISSSSIMAVGSHPGVSPVGAFDMAGNVREWCWNEVAPRSTRYVMGGAWTDPAYTFQEGYARSPFDRSTENGFRLVDYLDSPPSNETLAPVAPPLRDYAKEQPVSDKVFEAYRRLYDADPTPLDPKVESIDSNDERWIKEKVSFAATYGGERVPAYLFLPRNARPPYQAVIYFPGGSAQDEISSVDAIDINTFDFILLSGRAVLHPVYKGTYERKVAGLTRATRSPGTTASRAYANLIVQYNGDVRRGLDYLETREDIQKTAIGYLGNSWGGANGPIPLALDRRIKVALFLNGGFQPFRYPSEGDPLNFAPHATAPVLMLNGDSDSTFPLPVQKRLFSLLGTPAEHKRHLVYPGGHGVFAVRRSEMVKEMLDWLDRYLGHVAE